MQVTEKNKKSSVETVNSNKTPQKIALSLSYKAEVLGVNSDFKKANGTLGGVRTILLALSNEEKIKAQLHPIIVKALQDSKGKKAENKAIYEFLKDNVYFHPKTGKTGQFFVIRSIRGVFNNGNKFESLLNCYANSEEAKAEYIALFGEVETPNVR